MSADAEEQIRDNHVGSDRGGPTAVYIGSMAAASSDEAARP